MAVVALAGCTGSKAAPAGDPAASPDGVVSLALTVDGEERGPIAIGAEPSRLGDASRDVPATWLELEIRGGARTMTVRRAKYPDHAIMVSLREGEPFVGVVRVLASGALAGRPDFGLGKAESIEVRTRPAAPEGYSLTVRWNGDERRIGGAALSALPEVPWREQSKDRAAPAWSLRDVLALAGDIGAIDRVDADSPEGARVITAEELRAGSVRLRRTGDSFNLKLIDPGGTTRWRAKDVSRLTVTTR